MFHRAIKLQGGDLVAKAKEEALNAAAEAAKTEHSGALESKAAEYAALVEQLEGIKAELEAATKASEEAKAEAAAAAEAHAQKLAEAEKSHLEKQQEIEAEMQRIKSELEVSAADECGAMMLTHRRIKKRTTT